jgi:hypothetical protein
LTKWKPEGNFLFTQLFISVYFLCYRSFPIFIQQKKIKHIHFFNL